MPRYEDAQLARIAEPALVVTGDRDEIAGLDQALRLYRHIPRAELAVVPAASHEAAMGPLFWQITLDFVERHAAGA